MKLCTYVLSKGFELDSEESLTKSHLQVNKLGMCYHENTKLIINITIIIMMEIT